MIAKLWNENLSGYAYFDKVLKVQVEPKWAFTKYILQDMKDGSITESENDLCQVRCIDGELKIIPSSIRFYDEDFRPKDVQKRQVNDLNDLDAIKLGIHLTKVLEIEFEDGKHIGILISSDNNFLLNSEGKTIQRI